MFKRRARVLLGLLLAASATLLLAGCHSHYGASIRASSSSYYSDYLYGSRFRLGGGHYQVLYRPRGYGSGYYFVSTYLSGARVCGRFCYSRGNTPLPPRELRPLPWLRLPLWLRRQPAHRQLRAAALATQRDSSPARLRAHVSVPANSAACTVPAAPPRARQLTARGRVSATWERGGARSRATWRPGAGRWWRQRLCRAAAARWMSRGRGP